MTWNRNTTTAGLRPHMTMMSRGQLQQLHDSALHILERTGLVLHLEEAVSLLSDAGAWVEASNRVRIPSFLVENALKTVPGRITLYNRDGLPAMFLEGLNSYYGPGPTIQYVYDVYTGERRATDNEDIKRTARLCDYLPNIDFVMTMGMTGGVNPRSGGLNPEVTDRHDFAAMLKNTRKPLIYSAWTREGLSDIWEMARAVKGSEDLVARQPFMILFTQPISPLVIDREPLRQLMFCAEKELPMIFSSAPMMGATAPNTIAGSVAQSLAEFLGALVISQLKRPGAPVIMGIGYGPMDFKKGTSPYNGPEYYLSKLINKEMASFYGVPDWGYGGLTDAKTLDCQAASEAALSLFTATSTGSNLIHDVGFMEMGMTASMELMVLSDELIGSFKHYFKEVRIDDDTLAMDLIDRVGPGGNFLSEKHTVDQLGGIWQPQLFDRNNYMLWDQEGRTPLEARLTEKVKWIFENYEPERLAPDIATAVDDIVVRAGARY